MEKENNDHIGFSLIILAGGNGSRLSKYPCPKPLLPLHNKSILDRIIEFWNPAETIIVCNPKIIELIKKYTDNKYKYVEEYRGSAFSVKIGLDSATYDRVVLNWCDVLPLKKPALDQNFFLTSKDILCTHNGKMGGIYGVFSWDKRDVLYPSDIPELKDETTILDVFSLDNFVEISIPAIDIGDADKYKKSLMVDEHPIRSFNKILVGDQTVIKICKDDKLRYAEENWYKEMSGLSCVSQPLSYNPLTMKKINGLQCFDKVEPLYDLAQKIHNYKSPIESNRNDCINMYINKTLERLDNIRYLVDFGEEFFVNGTRCVKPAQTLKSINIDDLLPDFFTPIHGDLTTSNVLWEDNKPYVIDPRGIFGNTLLYGDPDYDIAKIHYSSTGWHLLNKGFLLPKIVAPNSFIIGEVPLYGSKKIDFLLAVIWLSVTSYVKSNVLSVIYSYLLGSYLLTQWVNRWEIEK